MHFQLIPENEFIHEIKCNGMTSFMEFMMLYDFFILSQQDAGGGHAVTQFYAAHEMIF